MKCPQKLGILFFFQKFITPRYVQYLAKFCRKIKVHLFHSKYVSDM